MEKKKFENQFLSIDKTQVLSDDMMLSVEAGDKCENGCKKACVPGNKSGGGPGLEVKDIDVL